MIETVLVAILRKVIFMGLVFGWFKVVDNYYLKSFDTDVEIGKNPIAIAIVVGLFFVALALA